MCTDSEEATDLAWERRVRGAGSHDLGPAAAGLAALLLFKFGIYL